MKNVFAEAENADVTWASNPSFDRRHLRAIELALRAAWLAVHNNYATTGVLSSADEVRISHLLRDALNELRERETGGVDGYNCDIFERPYIGAEILTPDGKIRKPDVVFSLSGRPRPGVINGMRDGIYVECKILEQGTKKNMVAYCKDGVHRFVEGSYAAWMREGMMLAYVRTKQSLPDDLAKLLGTDAMRKHLASNGELTKCSLTWIGPRVYISTHQRAWPYPGEEGYPGPIEIRHLWLYV